MGTYTELYVADYPLYSTKSAVDTTVMTVFREEDKVVAMRKVSERNRLMWSGSADSDEEEKIVEYSISVSEARDRLNLMGFTLKKAKAWFDVGVNERLMQLTEFSADGHSDLWAEEISLLKNLTFDRYTAVLKEIIERKIVRWTPREEMPKDIDPLVLKIIDDQRYDDYYYFPVADIRYFIATVLSLVPSEARIVQDITDLVSGGYYEVNEEVCRQAVDDVVAEYLADAKTLVLTEGSTDRRVIEGALNLLYPHLAGYFSFMDFGLSKAAGGAPALVTTLKSFIGAGIGNKVIAIFDNDTAAKAALRGLANIVIPPNIRVLTYPSLKSAEHYPTLGPTGVSQVDVNGAAGSIELYFGEDVLNIDGNLMPVQWKGYDTALSRYQGELLDKGILQKRFFEKIAACANDPTLIMQTDWTGIKSILEAIFDAFDE